MPSKTIAAATTDRRAARSQAEWNALALDTIVPALQAGTTMTEIRATYGAGPTIRRALDRVGYNTKGQQVDKAAIKATGAALAKRVHARRLELASWWRLEHETGKSQDELKALLAKHGLEDTAAGRVTRVQANEAKANKPARKSRKAKSIKVPANTEVPGLAF